MVVQGKQDLRGGCTLLDNVFYRAIFGGGRLGEVSRLRVLVEISMVPYLIARVVDIAIRSAVMNSKACLLNECPPSV